VKTERDTDERTTAAEDDEQSFAPEDEPTRAAAEGNAREDEAEGISEKVSAGPSIVERLWLVAAAALLIAAAVLLYLAHTDAAFVTATLGVCAWFLNVRDRLKREHNLRKSGPRNWGPR